MMKTRSLLTLTAVCLLALALSLPAHGQSGIIVNGAATVRQENTSLNPDLSAAASSVGPRVTLWNANTVRHQPITTPPGDLQGLFSAVRPRVVIQAAKTNRSNMLSYPVALIGDATQPQISAIAASRQGSTATVSWTTDEFADSAVLYGAQSGNLTQTISDPLYVEQHQMTLTGLASGVAYYYRVRSVDLSGNVALSQERVLQGQSLLFVPLIRRSN